MFHFTQASSITEHISGKVSTHRRHTRAATASGVTIYPGWIFSRLIFNIIPGEVSRRMCIHASWKRRRMMMVDKSACRRGTKPVFLARTEASCNNRMRRVRVRAWNRSALSELAAYTETRKKVRDSRSSRSFALSVSVVAIGHALRSVRAPIPVSH